MCILKLYIRTIVIINIGIVLLISAQTKLECPGGFPTGLYVEPKTDLLYVGCYGGIWEYNVSSNSWKEVDSDPAYPILANAKVIEMLIDSKGVFYAGCDANTQSYISYDGGKKWEMIESVHFTLQKVFDIYEHTNGSVYFSTGSGVVKTSDNGKTWVKLSNTPQGINSVFSNSKGEIYLAASNGLFKSSGDESVWQRVTLPGLIKPAFSMDKHFNGTLYLGIDGGILKSENDGSSWTIESSYYTINKIKIVYSDYILSLVGFGGSLSYYNLSSADWKQVPWREEFIFPNYSEFSVDSNNNIFGLSTRYGLLKTEFNPTSVEDNLLIPENYTLLQNYPNPFNPATTISYQLPAGGHVKLKIYDLLGREVAILVDEYKQAGTHNCEWRTLPAGRQVENGELTSGIYFYTLKAGNYISTKKMVLLK
jgi:ligand-binding sensor domain-containing protein